MDQQSTNQNLAVQRFSGFADVYDRYRPRPPEMLASLLSQIAEVNIPELVVDLGCGTGLSTRYWQGKARQIIGIEPSPDMLQQAESVEQIASISYHAGVSHTTGLPAQCTDIVTCSQSLHWMNPLPTFQESKRILRVGGVFAAYDYDWPPTTPSWEADAAYEECMQQIRHLEQQFAKDTMPTHWPKHEHFQRMKSSECFRYVKEVVLHHIEQGNAERFVGVLLSQGGVASLLKHGLSEEEMGIERFRTIATRTLGETDSRWFWSSRIRIGII